MRTFAEFCDAFQATAAERAELWEQLGFSRLRKHLSETDHHWSTFVGPPAPPKDGPRLVQAHIATDSNEST